MYFCCVYVFCAGFTSGLCAVKAARKWTSIELIIIVIIDELQLKDNKHGNMQT